MSLWFRSWHGAPTDPKWRTVARRAGVRPGDVFAVVSCLWDRASQSEERGSIAGYDAEVIADSLGYDPDEVERIITALNEKGVLADDRVTAWEKYQPRREDDKSTDRVKAFRDRQKAKETGQSDDMKRDETQMKRTETLEESRVDTDKKERILCTKSAAPFRTGDKYPVDFEEFWKAYPTDANMSKAKTAAQWKRLTPDQKIAAHAGVPGFRSYCAKHPDYRPVHAIRFLSEGRFEGFVLENRPAQSPTVFVEVDSPEWIAWVRHRGKTPVITENPNDRSKRGWYFPTAMPPDQEARH